MSSRLELGRFSLGVGDRFEREALAQLRACQQALEEGVEIVPVWNKSNREHLIIGSEPAGTRKAADGAVAALGWQRPYFVDADHIRLETVDRFILHSDFFTIDVADAIGEPAGADDVQEFVGRHPELVSIQQVPNLQQPLPGGPFMAERAARTYLVPVRKAADVFRYISGQKGEVPFLTEVSLDETDIPQSAFELLVILAALADEGVPLCTIAPRFCGSFHKGVDYIGDISSFERQLNDFLSIIAFAVERYGLPPGLKLSLHSGSDKFSLYPLMGRALARTGAGLHLKTAGTTWLEELLALVDAGGDSAALAKEIALEALNRLEELCAPYKSVIGIELHKLPSPATIADWNPEEFAAAFRHERGNPAFNPHFRQLLHVAYKLAAERKEQFSCALEECRSSAGAGVTLNLYERHLKPIFLTQG